MTDEDDRETDVSAEPTRAQAPPRIPRPHGHQKRPQGAFPPSRQGPQAPLRLRPGEKPDGFRGKTVAGLMRLTRRSDYQFVAKGVKAGRTTVLVQGRALPGAPPVAVAGFTTSKKVGNAVVRNRARRRMKEAARLLLPQLGVAGCGYVFIARDVAATAPWPALLDDMKSALIRLASLLSGEPKSPKQSTPSAPESPSPPSRRTGAPANQTDEPC